MEVSNLGYQTWAKAIYLSMTCFKSVSSMKLHRDLEIRQKSAWHLMHRLRTAYGSKNPLFSGPVEVNETYVGGIRKNMPKSKRKQLTGRGAVVKTAVVDTKDRDTNKVTAKAVDDTAAKTLLGFVRDNLEKGAMVYTDDASAYIGLTQTFGHEAAEHDVSEYVRGQAYTNDIDSFWAMLKRAHKGTCHKLSAKHLDRYVQVFAVKHNLREKHTVNIMATVASGMEGKRVRYEDLIALNGLDNGARL